MGRPKNYEPTVSKSYMLYQADINNLGEIGQQAKNIFRLGMMAYKAGWSPHKESQDMMEFRTRIKTMSWTLESYVNKFNKLCAILEKTINIQVDPEVVTTKELEDKLKELDRQSAKLNKKEKVSRPSKRKE